MSEGIRSVIYVLIYTQRDGYRQKQCYFYVFTEMAAQRSKLCHLKYTDGTQFTAFNVTDVIYEEEANGPGYGTNDFPSNTNESYQAVLQQLSCGQCV